MRKFIRTRASSSRDSAPALRAHPDTNGHATDGSAGAGAGAAAGVSLSDDGSTFSSSAAAARAERWCAEPPWEDPEFPASWRSLGDRGAARGLRWLRPHELCARPTLVGGGAAANDDSDTEPFDDRWSAEAGPLGDPHLRSAAAALALTPRLLERAAPRQRVHPAARYAFRFWVWGAWRELTVDDRVPCRGGRPLAASPTPTGDFTLPLLEKAYAKLYGSYRALRAGCLARALMDLSGGCVQALAVRAGAGAGPVARVLLAAVPRSTLVVVSGRTGAGGTAVVTGLARVRDGDALLLRLRCVCGATPATRAAPLPPADRDLLAASAPDPRDFWMSLGEFCGEFGRLVLVHVGLDDRVAEGALRARVPWREAAARRAWRAGVTAGGPPGARTHFTNPRFHVSVPRDETRAPRSCRAVVSLTQRYEVGAGAGAPLAAVGVCVYAVGAGGARRAVDAVRPAVAREVVAFLALPPGRYLVVPHTRRAHTDRAFLLRILTDERTDVWEENEDNAVVRTVSEELEETERDTTEEARAALTRLLGERDPHAEVDARRARAALARGGARCSAALCRTLVALRDAALRGTVRAAELPPLLALVQYWRHAYRSRGTRSSYETRALLAAAGVRVSNKVAECVVARFARARDRSLPLDRYLLALATLHLAHERHRSLDARMKSNPLSLEEMILMTVYS